MTPSAETGLTTMLVIVGGLGLLIGIAIYVWYAWALSRLFPRLDGEGWKGWVPVLNEAEILARGGVPAWSVVFYFIPLVQLYGLYLKVVATHRINRRFGRGAGMTVLAILLPPVWATVLAWGAAPYPEGERLAALQPGPRRTPPSTAPARDASGYTIPSLAPHSPAQTETSGLVFPDYAAPPRTPASAAAPAAGVGAPGAGAPAASFAPPTPGAPPTPATPPTPGAPASSFAPPAPSAPAPVAPAPPAFAPQPPPAPSSPPLAPAPAAHPAPPAPSAPQPPAPQPPVFDAAPPTPAPAKPADTATDAHPVTGIMATMGGAPLAPGAPAATPAPTPPAQTPPASVPPAPPVGSAATSAPGEQPQPASVRPAPPSFRDDGSAQREPEAPVIRPAPTGAVPEAPAPTAAPEASAPEAPAPVAPAAVAPAPVPMPLGGLAGDVDKTVVSPRPTDDDLEATVVVARRRGVRRSLVLDDGRTFALSGASVVIGRNPTGEAGEQRLAISDTTRTLSKTHARLVVQEDEWRLTDLHATNGVVVVADDGSETLLDPGESVVGNGRFILGEVGMHVIAERDS